MESKGARIFVVILAATAVIVLFLVLREDDEESGDGAGDAPATEQQASGDVAEGGDGKQKPEGPPEPEVATTEIEVEGGQPVGGIAGIELTKDEAARIVVTSSDTTAEVHLHGYDQTAELAPGEPAEIAFEATIEGVFEVELEETAAHIAEVTVSP